MMTDDRRGEPGEPGAPGEPGVGGGGTGGRGGRGGRGASLATGWKRWRGLIGYLLIILIAVVAVELHHIATTNEIKRTNREACKRSTLLADNQTFVLQTLSTILWEIDGTHISDQVRLQEILDRLTRIPRFECELQN